MWPAALRFVEMTRPGLAENLVVDEELLNKVQEHPAAATLRVWESPHYGVVVGRSNVIDQEVDVAACAVDGVPILRRFSGGGTVVVGPGCLCFSLALPTPTKFSQLGISGVTQRLMQRLADGWSTQAATITVQGISDLAIGDRKISGNAQRWRSRAFLHHGTLLYDFDLGRLQRYLQSPRRQPDYRRDRSHFEFVVNLGLPRDELVQRLRRGWNAIS
jgi:lipoate-protein ligase A